ncbi:MAG: (Na+)-NQR maturation NqrM [Pseudomonadota bacterium]
MLVFVLSFLIMSLIVAGMAIGAMAGRGPLKGSCGGLAAVGIEGRCEICGDDPSRCKNSDQTESEHVRETSTFDAFADSELGTGVLFYDALARPGARADASRDSHSDFYSDRNALYNDHNDRNADCSSEKDSSQSGNATD